MAQALRSDCTSTLYQAQTMFRDTSAQDKHLTPPARLWQGPAFLVGGVALIAAMVLGLPALARMFGSDQSVGINRLSLAEVKYGPLTRDIAGEGKVVAAVSPTLYAGSAGTVTLAVQAGDAVQKGQVLVRLASPELVARLGQERSNADALQSEMLRAEADARQQRAQAQSALETAAIAHKTAQNDLARQKQAFEAGATARMQVDQAQDVLERAQVALKQAQQLQGLKDEASKFELQAKRQAFERQQMVVRDVQRQQDELAVRSPVDGQVGQLFVSERMSVARRQAAVGGGSVGAGSANAGGREFCPRVATRHAR